MIKAAGESRAFCELSGCFFKLASLRRPGSCSQAAFIMKGAAIKVHKSCTGGQRG